MKPHLSPEQRLAAIRLGLFAQWEGSDELHAAIPVLAAVIPIATSSEIMRILAMMGLLSEEEAELRGLGPLHADAGAHVDRVAVDLMQAALGDLTRHLAERDERPEAREHHLPAVGVAGDGEVDRGALRQPEHGVGAVGQEDGEGVADR